MTKHVHIHLRLRKARDANSSENRISQVKAEIKRLEGRMNAYTGSAPLQEKAKTAEKLKQLRGELKSLGVKDADTVAMLIRTVPKVGGGSYPAGTRIKVKTYQGSNLYNVEFPDGHTQPVDRDRIKTFVDPFPDYKSKDADSEVATFRALLAHLQIQFEELEHAAESLEGKLTDEKLKAALKSLAPAFETFEQAMANAGKETI
jgi:hypothetical protein